MIAVPQRSNQGQMQTVLSKVTISNNRNMNQLTPNNVQNSRNSPKKTNRRIRKPNLKFEPIIEEPQKNLLRIVKQKTTQGNNRQISRRKQTFIQSSDSPHIIPAGSVVTIHNDQINRRDINLAEISRLSDERKEMLNIDRQINFIHLLSPWNCFPYQFLPLFSQNFYIIQLLKTTHPIDFLDSSNWAEIFREK